MGAPLVSISKRVIKVQPTFTADDNTDNDVAFNWTAIPNAFSSKGRATTLNSIFILNGYDQAHVLELVFCKGNSTGNNSPSGAQKLGHGSAAVDITQAESQAVQICGHVNIVADDYAEGDLLTARIAQKTGIGLVISPELESNSLYVAGVWRADPADMSSLATDLMDIYLGFED